jgi:hypothetical protein
MSQRVENQLKSENDKASYFNKFQQIEEVVKLEEVNS